MATETTVSRADERAAWLSWPIWGLAVAAIFLAYNAVGSAGLELGGWTGWLWVPWVLLGIAGTRLTARTLDAELPGWRQRSFWVGWLAGAAVFGLVEGLVALAPSPAGPNAANLVYTGGIAAGLAALQRVRQGLSPAAGVVVGAGLVGLAFALPALVPAEALRGLLAALAVAVGFALVGALGLRGSA